MTGAIDGRRELDEIEACLEEFAALRRRIGGQFHRLVEAVSGWSCAEHLYHLALATDLSLRNARSLASGQGPLIVHGGTPSEVGQRLLREGVFPRGQAEAPRMVRPPAEVDESFLDEEEARNRATIEALRTEIESGALERAEGRVPHQILGPFSALEWVRFAHLHARHHLAIAADIEAALRL